MSDEVEVDPVAEISDEQIASLEAAFGRRCTRGLRRSFRMDGDRMIVYRTIRITVEAQGVEADALSSMAYAVFTDLVKSYVEAAGPGVIEWRTIPEVEISPAAESLIRGHVARARCRLAVVPEAAAA